MRVTNWYWLDVDALDQCTCLINIALANNEKLPCAAFKIRNINRLLQNLGTGACICAPMCTPIRLIIYFFVLAVSCLPQSFDERMPSFLSHYWIPVLWWAYHATVAVMLKVFFFLSVWSCANTYSVISYN